MLAWQVFLMAPPLQCCEICWFAVLAGGLSIRWQHWRGGGERLQVLSSILQVNIVEGGSLKIHGGAFERYSYTSKPIATRTATTATTATAVAAASATGTDCKVHTATCTPLPAI